ncbi:MAG: hypothetical protein KAJ97_08470, partial [Acidobacteria bacterium]|nr:hypothetical protein [Acidobacteriota bacterium]
ARHLAALVTKPGEICGLATLLAAAFLSGAEPVRQVSVYDGHVSLEVPVSWQEIPTEVLEFFSLRAAEASGGKTAEIYQHGFRPGDPEMDFALPQILIQIRESGRLAYGQFLHLPPLAELRSDGEQRLAERAGPMLNWVELDEVSFDHASFSLRVTNTLDLRVEGIVRVDSVSFLTERGLFTIHCYAPASQTGVFAPLFADIIASVRLGEDIAYRPRLADRWPPALAVIAYTAAGLSAVILLALVIRRRTHP